MLIFGRLFLKKIREMGFYLITYCCHPPIQKTIVIHGHSTVRPWSTPEATTFTHAKSKTTSHILTFTRSNLLASPVFLCDLCGLGVRKGLRVLQRGDGSTVFLTLSLSCSEPKVMG